MEQVVHANIFKPHKSIFKQFANNRASVSIVLCNNSDNCGLYKRGECSLTAILGVHSCPYGKFKSYIGYTKKAKGYTKWIEEQESKYKDVKSLRSHSDMMAVVGDFIFLPYAHMTLCKTVSFQAHGSLFVNGNCFIHKDKFTVPTIISLVHFKPQAFMGGEIKTYQKEVPPKFMKHLSEQLPSLFKEVMESDEYARQRYQEFTNVGRKAILETLTPNCGTFKDIHGGLWKWDGENLTSTNSHASFLLVNKFSKIIVTPEPDQEVVVTAESQVNDNTVFTR